MNYRKMLNLFLRFFLFLIFFLLSISCQKESSELLIGPAIEGNLIHLDKLESGKIYKLNDYPLFVMSYNGDYGFSNFLKTGDRKYNIVHSMKIPQ